MKIRLYYVDEYGDEYESFLEAALLFELGQNSEYSDYTDIKNCILYIPEDVFLDSDFIKIKIEVGQLSHLSHDYKAVNFGHEQKHFMSSHANFERFIDVNPEDKIDSAFEKDCCDYEECEDEQCVFAVYNTLSFTKDAIYSSQNEAAGVLVEFNVNNRVQTVENLPSIETLEEIKNMDISDFANLDFKTLREHAKQSEPSLLFQLVPFVPTQENLLKHYGEDYMQHLSSGDW